ncbi:MAG: CoB--CoM heterodisulfide reductase iron-sulfur subunit A family protein [Dehalococcoidia bacterium]
MSRRIGVYVCECGNNIADNVDIDRITETISPMRDVELVERYRLLCSEDGKEFLKQSIIEHQLTHVVVAACSPKQHEHTFMGVCTAANLNPYLLQMANIREQCAWVTPNKEEATDKAIRQIAAAVARVAYHEALEQKDIDASPDVLVVGGGIAGIAASRVLASPDRKVYLVEKTSSLGGKVKSFDKLFTKMESGSALIESQLKSLHENENIEVLTDSEVEQILGFFGNFEVKVLTKTTDEERDLNVGAVVLATGFELMDPAGLPQYGYGKLEDVYTSMEFEEMSIPGGPTGGKIVLKNGKPPQSVAIVHCVGRDEKGYCSKVCCMYSLKFARMLKAELPEAKVAQLYSDLCIPGKAHQKFYEETKGLGVDFVRTASTKVDKNGKGMTIEYEGEGGSKGNLAADMVILVPAMEPACDTHRFAEMLGIPVDSEGFLAQEHQKLAPIASSVEGVFVVGCAQGPKSISESIVQSEAAAGKILSTLVPGRRLELEVKVSQISETFCTGCKTCISVCPYSAISFDDFRHIAVVNEALCHGCGVCAAACPSGAASVKNFAFTQIYREVAQVLR